MTSKATFSNSSSCVGLPLDIQTHVQLKGSTEPQAWANNTFLLNGPSLEHRAEKSNKKEVEEA